MSWIIGILAVYGFLHLTAITVFIVLYKCWIRGLKQRCETMEKDYE